MKLSEIDESQLMAKIGGGCKDSLAEYIQFRRFDLMAVILSKMGPGLRKKVEAEDIYQDVCAAAVQSLGDVQITDAGPFGWICKIAERKIIDQQRKFSAAKRDSGKEVGIFGKSDEDIGLANLLASSMTSPSRVFSRDQKEFHLLQAMNGLPDTQRRVLELRYSEGKSSKEIASEIGKSDGATRVLLTRSLQSLKKAME